MRTPRVKANVIRWRAARRGATLLALALAWTALVLNIPRVGETAGENASPGAVSKPTGSAARQLSPSESDGKIAFTSNRNGNFEIYVMNADGTNQTRVTRTRRADSGQPAFPPSGSKIVFTSNRDDNDDVSLDDNFDLRDERRGDESDTDHRQPGRRFRPSFRSLRQQDRVYVQPRRQQGDLPDE